MNFGPLGTDADVKNEKIGTGVEDGGGDKNWKWNTRVRLQRASFK